MEWSTLGHKNLVGLDEVGRQPQQQFFLICDTIQPEYDTRWELVYCKLAGKCRRKALLEYYDEEVKDATESCCGVCDGADRDFTPCTKEAKSLVQAVQALGSKGECKVSEFLRGSYSLWLTDEDKEDISYGAGRDHSFGMVVNIH